MNTLILLGSSVAAAPPVSNTKQEPYRIVWNPVAIQHETQNYISPSEKSGYLTKVDSLEPLTDYDPLDNSPTMHSPEESPHSMSLLPWGVVKYEVTADRRPPLTIFDTQYFAHADRTGLLPKGFEFRFGFTGSVPNLDVFKYNLNAEGSRFLAVHIREGDNVGDVIAKPVLCFDGSSIVEGDEVLIASVSPGDVSDNILLVLFPDRFSVTDGWSEVSSVHFDSQVTMTKDAHITLFDESRHPKNPPNTLYSDLLTIHDAYW